MRRERSHVNAQRVRRVLALPGHDKAAIRAHRGQRLHARRRDVQHELAANRRAIRLEPPREDDVRVASAITAPGHHERPIPQTRHVHIRLRVGRDRIGQDFRACAAHVALYRRT